MASTSIQGRVDGALWQSLKGKHETNTQLLQRLTDHYQATTGTELSAIAPTPAAAIAVLLHSHNLLTQLANNSSFAPAEALAKPTDTTEISAIESADDW